MARLALLRRLEHLALAGCDRVTDAALCQLAAAGWGLAWMLGWSILLCGHLL
jgi:hypothetical protein